ncbi:MAG: response regulator [Candidatus Ancaeobacter aquaticus]|nr:response regulator [Candidatus Ancaeobacter aquaticus]
MTDANLENKKTTHVLLIDDEADFLFAIEAWMLSKGFRVSTATDGRKGIELFKKDKPHIVFVDVLMPEMDGVETLKEIRKLDEKVPVILITAFGLNKRIEEAEKYGVFGFFRKSQDFEQAAALICDAIDDIEKMKGQ